MAKIEKIERMKSSDKAFMVTLDQEIWDSIALKQCFIVYANDEMEAYNITMKGLNNEQSRTRQGIY